ncbi:hypothetical protein GmHk_11G032013 [Glycine max]|nr:hypothetical protein GmHk_11G032013 [Glycine max]
MFVKDHQLSYKAVDVDAYSNLDNDTWSYYEALALVICLGYQCSQLRLWWKLIEVNFEDGLKQFSDDKHALELEEYAVNNNGEANLYVEHLSVNQPQYISYEELLQLAHAFLDEDEGERNGAHVDENDGAEVGHEDVQHVVQMLKLVLRWRGEEAPKGGTDGGVGPYENDVVDDGGSQNVVNESGDVVCHNENGADNVMSTGQFEDEDDSFSPSTSKASDEDIDDDTEFHLWSPQAETPQPETTPAAASSQPATSKAKGTTTKSSAAVGKTTTAKARTWYGDSVMDFGFWGSRD